MAILALDWGGTNVKHGVWHNEQLINQGIEKTPKTYDEMKALLLQIKEQHEKDFTFEGVAISAPGAVNYETGVIEGLSAIPYIHHFDIRQELTELFQLPVKLENDANAAGIAETWQGVAKGLGNVLFVVLGTGVGGAIIQDGKLNVGAHRYGGEFGLMYLTPDNTFSELGTAVKMVERFALRTQQKPTELDAKKVFALAEEGDEVAIDEVNNFYNYLAQGLFSLMFCFDPDCIVIGGGVSAKEGLVEEVTKRVQEKVDRLNIKDYHVDIRACQFGNDANLIGAVASYYQQL
ncbi:ROK family protein [Vagococcus xieshaowenii]|uniref:ROK family protein n=1 Tax=Vagococcus xieshaowenii TaxID=2562451 RepID=A0AAJ5JLG6_9ENTE|nr:ROK family protein [Vagococcus xieshaowenii]QCA28518.1 ROK family protein [Vagococcus xieshaowenii]TFZ42729.1 ROK family protein [Vagococcus xieshaowenii]